MKSFFKYSFVLVFLCFFSVAKAAVNNLVFVANSNLNVVSALNTTTGIVEKSYTVGNGVKIMAVALNQAQTKVYVLTTDVNNLYIIDLSNDSVSSLAVSAPFSFQRALAVSPDEATCYVLGPVNIYVVSLPSGTVTDSIVLGTTVKGLALSSDPNIAYVTTQDNRIVKVQFAPLIVGFLSLSGESMLTPKDIVIKPGTNTAYIVNQASTYGAISTIEDLTLIPAPVKNNLGTGGLTIPNGIALSSDGSMLIVSNGDDLEHGGMLSAILIDPIDPFTLTGTLNTPNGIAIRGSTAYIVNTGDQTVSVVNLQNQTVTSTITGFNSPNSIALGFINNTLYAYVTNDDNSLSVVNLSSPSPSPINFHITVGSLSSPKGIAIYGTNAYICNSTANSVSVLDIQNATSGGIVHTYSGIFTEPTGIVLNSNGTKAYVTNAGDGTHIGFINIAENFSNSIALDGASISITTPKGIALSPDGTRAFVIFDNSSVAVINLCQVTEAGAYMLYEIFSSASLATPNGIAVNSDGTKALITNSDGTLATLTFPPASFGINTPSKIKISPDGNLAYVTFGYNNLIYGFATIDLASSEIRPIYALDFNNPSGLVLNSTGDAAYVTNFSDSFASVSLVDLTNTPPTVTTPAFLKDNIDITHPVDIVLGSAPSINGKGYLLNFTDDAPIAVIDFASSTVHPLDLTNPGVFIDPVALTIIGTTLYVANSNGGNILKIENINTDPNPLTAVALPGGADIYYPTGICATSNGTKLYVVNSDPISKVVIVDPATGAEINNFSIGPNAYSITLSPDNSKAYITYLPGDIEERDATTLALIKRIGFDFPFSLTGSFNPPNSPAVTGVSPSSGSAGGSVTLTGSDFLGATYVFFGSNAASFSLNPDNSISATVPPGDGTVDVKVITRYGTSATTSLDQFTYGGETISFTPVGKQTYRSGLFETDIVNELSWNSIPTAAKYNVYDSNMNLLFQGLGLTFYQHNVKAGSSYRYFVSWTDSLGVESTPVSVTLL